MLSCNNLQVISVALKNKFSEQFAEASWQEQDKDLYLDVARLGYEKNGPPGYWHHRAAAPLT